MAFEFDAMLKRGGREIAAKFAAPAGLIGLFGVSGAGKTTLLDMIAGLLTPTKGRIRVADRLLFDSSTRVNMPPEQRGCGYVFQDNRLFPHLNVRDNLLYGANRPDATMLMPLDKALDFLGIGALLKRMPHTLSGGEAQRVAIGRALLSGPRFLLMDEPLASLDSARRAEILEVITRIRDELKLPILYVSHDRAELDRLANMVVELEV